MKEIDIFIMQGELTKEDSFWDGAGTFEKYVEEDSTQYDFQFEYINNRNFSRRSCFTGD